MSLRNNWAVLFVSSILAAFALGVLFTRPANAQFGSALTQFPRISELWSFQLNHSNFTAVQMAEMPEGWMVAGFPFDVTVDGAGRLPVLTGFLSHAIPGESSYEVTDGSFELWKDRGDGSYVRVFSRRSSHPVYQPNGTYTNSSATPEGWDELLVAGLPLSSGHYLYRLPQNSDIMPYARDVVLTGHLTKQ
jgi:hypothetical protein